MNAFSLFLSCLALWIAVVAIHRNAVLSNEVGKCKIIEITLQGRCDELEAKLKAIRLEGRENAP